MARAFADRHCVPCTKGTPPLGAAAIEQRAREIPAWTADAKSLRRRFTFPDFDAAFALVTRVAALARAEDHHPDISVGWGYAAFVLSTHAIGGLSENDFIIAAGIDREAGQV